MKIYKIFFLFIFFFLFFESKISWAENLCPQNACENISDLNLKVACLSDATEKCGKQRVDLISQINYMDTQIKLTTTKIYQTQKQIIQLDSQIASLSGQIDRLQNSLGDLSKILLSRIVETYKRGDSPPFYFFFSTNGFSDLLSKLKYLRLVQAHDKKLMFAMQQTKDNYTDQKQAREDKKQQQQKLQNQLDGQKVQLAQQVKDKQTLLEVTQGQEQRYQDFLSQAKAQLAAIRRFVSSQGGASILSDQTKCNEWGCYYNQRDGNWGQKLIGSSNENMADVGCLVTSVAMILSHYNKKITPADIASTLDAFVPGTAYMWYRPWSVNGIIINRSSQLISTGVIDSELQAGRPVIIGLYSGPGHFIVLKSGSNGNYIMNDPFMENGSDVSFNSKYNINNITEVDKISIN